jgi:hypothetical protein
MRPKQEIVIRLVHGLATTEALRRAKKAAEKVLKPVHHIEHGFRILEAAYIVMEHKLTPDTALWCEAQHMANCALGDTEIETYCTIHARDDLGELPAEESPEVKDFLIGAPAKSLRESTDDGAQRRAQMRFDRRLNLGALFELLAFGRSDREGAQAKRERTCRME